MLASDIDRSSFAPAVRMAAVAPHATNPLPEAADYLFVGTGGNLVFKPAKNSGSVTMIVASGSYVWCKTAAVVNTSTASGILACYTKDA